MLSDALQSPDLDEDVYDKTSFSTHPVLVHFERIALTCMSRSLYLLFITLFNYSTYYVLANS